MPEGLRWIVERVGPHLEAAIVHDFLFIAWQLLSRGARRKDLEFANAVMYAALEKADVPWFEDFAIRRALNNFSYDVYAERDANLFFDFPDRYKAKTTGLARCPWTGAVNRPRRAGWSRGLPHRQGSDRRYRSGRAATARGA
ncbi:MAG: DUF1353 domain-containing protein [Paracoccaceae bacterium]